MVGTQRRPYRVVTLRVSYLLQISLESHVGQIGHHVRNNLICAENGKVIDTKNEWRTNYNDEIICDGHSYEEYNLDHSCDSTHLETAIFCEMKGLEDGGDRVTTAWLEMRPKADGILSKCQSWK